MARKSTWEKKYDAKCAEYTDLLNRKMQYANEKVAQIEVLSERLEKANHLLREQSQAIALYMMARSQLAITNGNVNAHLQGTIHAQSRAPNPQGL